MRPVNMVLIDYGPVVICKDSKQVSFGSYEEFIKYAGNPGHALGGKTYMCYIPDQEVHTDVASNLHGYVGRVDSYDALIDMYDLLVERKADPLWGLSYAESKMKKLELDLQLVDEEIVVADHQTFEYDGHQYYPDTEFIQGIFSVLPLLPANYTESWKTADKEADGISNVYVTLDKAGIQGLALAYLQFKKTNWAIGDAKKKTLKNTFKEG